MSDQDERALRKLVLGELLVEAQANGCRNCVDKDKELERLRKQLAIAEAACDMWRGVAFTERTGGEITTDE